MGLAERGKTANLPWWQRALRQFVPPSRTWSRARNRLLLITKPSADSHATAMRSKACLRPSAARLRLWRGTCLPATAREISPCGGSKSLGTRTSTLPEGPSLNKKSALTARFRSERLWLGRLTGPGTATHLICAPCRLIRRGCSGTGRAGEPDSRSFLNLERKPIARGIAGLR